MKLMEAFLGDIPVAMTAEDKRAVEGWLLVRKFRCIECEEAKPWEEMHRGGILFFASGVVNAFGECKECRKAGEAMNG